MYVEKFLRRRGKFINYNLLIFHELTKILNISRFEMGAINLKKTKLGFLKTKLPLLGNNNLG